MARCAGPRPTRPCGLRAAHPAHPVRRRCRRPPGLPAAVREMWRLVAACGGSGQASRQPLRGATQSGRKAKPLRGRFAGLAPGQPRAGCGVGAPGRPGPHDVGAVGPSAPPARSAALRPALPARPRLRRRPCRAALPTHSPPGVAAPRGSRWPASGPRQAAPRALAPPAGRKLSPGLRRSFGSRRCGGPQFKPPRALAAQAPPPRAFARGGARGNAACGRECRPFPRPARPRQAPRRAASRPQAGALPAGAPASEGKTWRVSRPLAGSRPSLILVNGGAFMFAVACRISASGRVWWLVCRSGGVFGWSLSRPARSLWPSALAAASACQLAAESAPGCFWPAGAPVGRLAVVRCK